MSNWTDIDLDDSGSDEQSQQSEDDGGGWNDDIGTAPVVDDWEAAPSPEEIEKKKKEEEEQKIKEKQEQIEAQKKRKEEIREKKKKEKELLEQDFDSADDFFDVTTTNEQKQRADLQNALDALGGLPDTTDPTQIDIGVYKPDQVVHFKAFEDAIILKVNSIFPPIETEGKKKTQVDALKTAQDNSKVQLIKYLITALADSYQSAFLHELDAKITQYYNNRLEATKGKHKPKPKPKTGTYMSMKKDDFDDDDDDFM